MKLLSKNTLAAAIITIAGLVLVGSMGWSWYKTRTDFFLSGAPPASMMNEITPKKVPYGQIKPPAFLQTDALIYGSMTSTASIVFYGDYTDPKSNILARDIDTWVRTSKGKIRLIWQYLPATDKDGNASFEAAVFSECSRLMDDKWIAHTLMINMPKVGMSDVESLTDQLTDKDGMLYDCRKDKNIRDYVRTKVQTARGDGIDTAPFVFVGTHVFPSQSASSTSIIQAAQTYLRL
ncbi:MAG: thioredoxin domain-containing protein [Patescibacteria group bacterium]